MILETAFKSKRLFNINDNKDLNLFKSFLKNSSWGNEPCPFILEFPYLTIPDMIKDKLVHKLLKVKMVKYENCN